MYLNELKLWNFRKFGSDNNELDLEKPDLTAPFTEGLNVLIGENDSGKTAIIDAIKIVLDTHSSEWTRLVQEDFYRDKKRLRIECLFRGLSDEEAKHFVEWLGMVGEGKDAQPYLKVILDASKKEDGILPFDISAGADDEGHRLPAEAREYLKTIYLKPLRDAKSELVPRKNSRLSQILSGHEAFKNKNVEHTFEKVSICTNCLFQKYFKRNYKENKCPFPEENCPFERFLENDRPGEQIQKSIQGMINLFWGSEEYSATFGVIDKKLRNILEQFKLSLSDEELGLGSHNLLFIAAELLNLQRENWSGLRLALIEELEAHLEPQRQMRVVEFFQEITAKENDKDIKDKDKRNDNHKDIQIILTTHSPNLASKVKLQNLIICHDGKALPMGKDYTKLNGPDYAFLERFLDVTKANLFFAKGVILVEGWAEELILPALAKKIGKNLTQNGVSIINVGGKAFLRYARIFQRKDGQEMKLPVAVITDLDVKPKDENTKVNGQTKKKLKTQEKKAKYDGKKVKTFVSYHWTMEYCISKSKSLSKAFQTVTKKIHPEIADGCPFEQGLIDKLTKRTLNKTKIAFRLANKIEQEDSTITIDESDKPIKYLIDAIKYATEQNKNKKQ